MKQITCSRCGSTLDMDGHRCGTCGYFTRQSAFARARVMLALTLVSGLILMALTLYTRG